MSKIPEDATLKQLVDEYVITIQGVPNALGQHVHPAYGRSDMMLMIMTKRFGEAEVNHAMQERFQIRDQNKINLEAGE